MPTKRENCIEEKIILLELKVFQGYKHLDPLYKKGTKDIDLYRVLGLCSDAWSCPQNDFLGPINHSSQLDKIKKISFLCACSVWSNTPVMDVLDLMKHRGWQMYHKAIGKVIHVLEYQNDKYKDQLFQLFFAMDKECPERLKITASSIKANSKNNSHSIDPELKKDIEGMQSLCKTCANAYKCPMKSLEPLERMVYCPKAPCYERVHGVPFYNKNSKGIIYEVDPEIFTDHLNEFINEKDMLYKGRMAITTISGSHLYYWFDKESNQFKQNEAWRWREWMLKELNGDDRN